MKITKRQLQTLIREAIDIVNSETGEVIDFGEDSVTGIPDSAVPDLVKRLGLNVSPNDALSNDDWQKLEDETWVSKLTVPEKRSATPHMLRKKG